jgi:murein DD-endopeptidase MepM/ murein hydrolase activator NlpD
MKRLIFIFLFLPSCCLAGSLPQSALVPGGIAKIAVGNASQPAPKVFYQGRRILVTSDHSSWLAIVGIPLDAKPGPQKINIEHPEGTSLVNFSITHKQYPEQRLRIRRKRLVNEMNAQDLARIKDEKEQVRKIKDVWSDRPADVSFCAPVIGRWSSLFGLRRFLNNQPRGMHRGLDIAAKTDTAVLAPASGFVIGTGDYFFSGQTVFLDHGQGLLTAYMHLNEIAVRLGQTVLQGERLGTVGATGRATGPHLHWNVYLNQEAVDPTLFLPKGFPACHP